MSTNSTTTQPSKPRIGTHSGVFHADDVLACYMLSHHVRSLHNAQIIRTRDTRILSQCHALVDVGGVSDGSRLRFDHHQPNFNETYSPNFNTKLSSAGLVYKHFGPQIVRSICSDKNITHYFDASKADADLLVRKVYENLIECVDGKDNGIAQYGSPGSTELTRRYKNLTDLSSRISMLNPFWNETPTSCTFVMDRFEQAMAVAGKELVDCVYYLASCWLPARNCVRRAIANRFEYDVKGRVVVLESYVPWNDHFFEWEAEQDEQENELLYMIFGDIHSGTFRVQSIPINDANRFENRCPFPREWRGLTGESLCNVVGVSGCVFVHGNGFIGANRTKIGAVSMAKLSIEKMDRQMSGSEESDEEESVFLREREGEGEEGDGTTSSKDTLSLSLSLNEIALGIRIGTNRLPSHVKNLSGDNFVSCSSTRSSRATAGGVNEVDEHHDENCVGINFFRFFGV